MKNLCLLFLLLFMVGLSSTLHGQEKASASNDPFPPGEENARAALDKSPRHGEWIDISYDGKTPIRTWIVYPERKDKAPVVLMIHEIFGLSDWMRSVADQLAKEGFIAVAPDLISGFGPNGGGTASVSSRDSVVMLIRNLSAEETYKRLDAVREFALRLPVCKRKMRHRRILLGRRPEFRIRLHPFRIKGGDCLLWHIPRFRGIVDT